MGTEIAERKVSPIANLRSMMQNPEMIAEIKNALPKHLTPERMIRVFTTAVQKTPALLECSSQSLIKSLVEASQLGLEPDGVLGQAYLVPFFNKKTNQKEAQLMVGYKGWIALARRSGEVTQITAEIIYEADAFEYTLGLDPSLTHVPAWNCAKPGEIVGAYATAKLKDGSKQFQVMSTAEIKTHRARSKAASKGGPWDTDYKWMAKKTVLIQLCKLLPNSVEDVAAAMARDEMRSVGVMQADEIIPVEIRDVSEVKDMDTLAAHLEGNGAAKAETVDEETGEIIPEGDDAADDTETPSAPTQQGPEYENAYKHATTKLKRADPTKKELAKLYEGVGGQVDGGLESLSLEQLDNLCVLCDELTDTRKTSTVE